MSHNKENARPLHNRLSLSIQRQSLQPRHLPADPLKPTPLPPSSSNDFSRRLSDAKAYRGHDPLTQWFSFYQWTAEHQPSSLQLLLETALDSLQSDPSYPGSPHYVGLWLAYARLCPDPLPFYTDMHTQGVGSSLTSLYADWADALERIDNFDEADSVYMKALLQPSQPLAEAIQRYDAFKRRWAEKRKAATAIPSSTDSKKRAAGPEEPPRDVKQAKTTTAAPIPPQTGGDRDVPGYDERLLMLDGVECQFEEHRARRWLAAHPKPSPTAQPLPSPPSQLTRKANQRKALEPVPVPAPSPSLAPLPPPSSTPSRSREALAAFLQSGPLPAAPRAMPSPTVHTRAAMDDVDAMFRDLTSTLSARPSSSSAFSSASLTSELPSLTTPAPLPSDNRARPSPVAFSIHEDTELLREPAAALQHVAVYQDTGLLPSPVAVYEDCGEEDEEEEVVLQSDEAIARAGGRAAARTPTSQAGPRAMHLAGLTPIMETSRESDASSLSNASLRSSSSLAPTSAPRRLPSPRVPAAPTAAPTAEAGPLNPLATSIQALILSDLGVAASAGVTVAAGPAPTDVAALLSDAASCDGADVDVGDWWLRVEGRRAGEDVVDGEGAERRVLRVWSVTRMDSGAACTLHLHTPPSLWEHHMGAVVAARGVASQAALATATHVYADVSASLVPAPGHATLTLAALLAAYRGRGQALPPVLVAFYTHSLLHAVRGWHGAGVMHCGLTPAVCQLPADLVAEGEWGVGLTGGWAGQGLTVGTWTRGVDLRVWEGEEADWRGEDGRGVARMVWAMVAGERTVEEALAGKTKGAAKVGAMEGVEVVRRLWLAGGGEAGSRVLSEVKREMEVWMQGEGGARARQVKKAILTQSVMLSS